MASNHDELLHAPVVRLAALIRSREVSPVELVNAHIERLQAVDHQLNAVVSERYRDARTEALAAEATVRNARDPSALPPLLGVPCTIKDFLAIRDLPWSAGLHHRRDLVADSDATVVTRVRAAGAIIMAKTNVPEGGMWMETSNPIHGRTLNPWDKTRTPGGSSGGEAAVVAAAASPFGIASDVAGSIRIPAGMCGVVGHKPSELLVPNTGHWGTGSAAAERMLCVGPIARCVRDAELLLELIAGPDGVSGVTNRLRPSDPSLTTGDLRGVRVVPVTRHRGVRIAPVMAQMIERATAALAARGAEVVELDDAQWQRLFGGTLGAWLGALAEASEPDPNHPDAPRTFAELLAGGGALNVLPELLRAIVGRPRYSLPTLGLVALDRLARPFQSLITGSSPPLAELRTGFEDLLGPRGVLLHPPYSRPAPRHMWPMLTPMDVVCTSLFSITGLPATVVPVGFDDRELPVGVQIVARRGNDRLTLAAARVVEESTGGWVPAPMQPHV